MDLETEGAEELDLFQSQWALGMEATQLDQFLQEQGVGSDEGR